MSSPCSPQGPQGFCNCSAPLPMPLAALLRSWELAEPVLCQDRPCTPRDSTARCPSARVPSTAPCPLPTLPRLRVAVRGSGMARAHGAQGARPRSAAPTCLRAAGQARKSQRFLRSPGPEAFSSFHAGHNPTGRSSLASSFQAGAGGLGSGLSCAAPGHSPTLRAGRCLGDVGHRWHGHGSRSRGLQGPPCPSCPCPGTSPALLGKVPAAAAGEANHGH